MREVFLQTDQPRFYGDISEIIRIFVPECAVVLTEPEQPAPEGGPVVRCHLSDCDVKSQFFYNGREYEHTLPVTLPVTPIEEKRAAKTHCKHSVFTVMSDAFGSCPPWGCLTGIRPTKLFRDLCQTHSPEYARDRFERYYSVSPQKIALAEEIVREQLPIINSVKPTDFDLYVGIPFCATRCAYCSFAAYEVGKGCATAANMERYVSLLEGEIAQNVSMARSFGYNIRSIYIGGGTPTALSCAQLERVIAACLEACGGFGLEFTVEAGRPDTIDREKLTMLKRMNVGRISINPQSMNERTLRLIGRAHSPQDLLRAYAMAREVGFECINMDTIVGLPGESVQMVADTMAELQALAPENLTVHTLAIKRSSRLKESLYVTHDGAYELPGGDIASLMLDESTAGARRMGMSPYYMYRQKYMSGSLENIGFSVPDKQSVYNVDMMEETASVLALGAGAITKWLYEDRLERAPNPKDLLTYFEKSNQMYALRKGLLEKGIQMM